MLPLQDIVGGHCDPVLSKRGSAFRPSAVCPCALFGDARARSGTIEPRFGQFAPPFKQDTGDLGHARVHLLQVLSAGKAVYIGLNLGASGLKGVLIREDQVVLAEASAALSVARPAPGWSEQAPGDWIAAAQSVLDQLAVHGLENLRGIGLSGQALTTQLGPLQATGAAQAGGDAEAANYRKH